MWAQMESRLGEGYVFNRGQALGRVAIDDWGTSRSGVKWRFSLMDGCCLWGWSFVRFSTKCSGKECLVCSCQVASCRAMGREGSNTFSHVGISLFAVLFLHMSLYLQTSYLLLFGSLLSCRISFEELQ